MEKYYYGNKLINKKEDLEEDLNLKWNKIKKNHSESLKKQWWSTNYEGDLSKIEKYSLINFELRDRLLSFGGNEVVLPVIEDDFEDIMKRGNLWIPNTHNRVKEVIGSPCQCHKNSSELWDLNKDKFDIKICTGYALSTDLLWRQHSFLVFINKRTKKPQIIETTLKRIAYYGFVMTDEESERFCCSNF